MRNFLKNCGGKSIGRVGWLVAGICLAWVVPTAQGQVLFSDNFSRTNDPAPITPWLIPSATPSAWSITGGTMQSGSDTASSYGYVYVTNLFTGGYSVQAQFRFSTTGAWGGGVGGDVNTTNGAHYAAWIYPDASAGGGDAVRLIKFSTWTTFGYQGTNFAFMAATNVGSVGTNFHTLKLSFVTNQITVSYDGTNVISTTDLEAQPYTGGSLSFDMYTDVTPYTLNTANALVNAISTTPIANNDSYNATLGRTLSVAAPGVLANDTGGSGPLTAVLGTTTTHGTLTLTNNGGFAYTPNANFTGADTFTYKANDGTTNSALATVTITVSADHPPVANNDSYTLVGNTTLTVAAPGVLANDTDADGDSLTAVLVTAPTNGLLTLTNNGGFGYVPTNNFSGTDTFTYKANDGISNSTTAATVTLTVLPTSTLFFDTFASSSNPSPIAPWVAETGNWIVTGGALVSSLNPANDYAFAYLTNVWTNFSVQGQVEFSTNSFGGGIGGRLTSASGAHYAAWIYPENSPGGGPQLRLVKFSNYSTFGYQGTNAGFMAMTNLAAVGTGLHTLKLGFYGNQISVYLDGTQMFSVADVDATTYPTGGVIADMYAGSVADVISVENVIVSALANNDSYAVNAGSTLTVAAPGVLANDTPVFTSTLTAAQVTAPAHGSLTLSSNGGFIYTPTAGYSGPDSFTYQANDGTTNVGTATVNINVVFNGPSELVFSENFDEVTAPTLPTGWTTTNVNSGSNWVTTTVSNNTAPNSAFVVDVTAAGLGQLISPAIVLPAGPCQLTFKNNYNLEIATTNSSDGYDGGVLEIKIGTNAFTDVITAGGSFLAGGYNTTIDTTFGNPLAGRAAWSGSSAGFITTTVDLPPAASGQTVQLRWNLGTDTSNAKVGWWIDTVSISNCPTSVCWNTAPVLPPQISITNNELVPLTVTNTATDTDSPVQTLTYTLLASPSGAAIGLHTGIITWTSTQSQSPSTNTFTTRVVDNGTPALSATNSFTVVIKEVNVPPTLSAQANRTNFGLAPFTITNAATESNIHAVTTGYSLSGQPTGMTVTSNGVITWTPIASQVPNTYTITTTATNKDTLDTVNPILTTNNSFVLTAAAVHNGPTLGSLTAQTVNELIPLTVTNTAVDMDVPVLPLTYFLTNNSPANANISASGVITWTPQQSQSPGVTNITTVVTDGTKAATNILQVTVKEVNVAPVPPVIIAQTVNELLPLLVTNTATEANIHSVVTNYTIVSPLTGMAVSTNGIFSWTPSQTQSPTNTTVTIVVANTNQFDTNNPVLKATNSFTVAVKEVNVAPVPPSILPQTVNELTPLIVTNTASETNIHSVVTNYTIVSPLQGMNINSNGIFTWTPQQTQSPTNTTVTIVTANTNQFDTNNPVLAATNSFSVAVVEVNVAPTLPLVGPQTINELQPLTVIDTATESNIHSVTTGYTIAAPLQGMNVDSNGVFTWTPNSSQSPSVTTVTIIAANSNPFDTLNPVLVTSNSFSVTVKEVNIAPQLPVITPQTVNELIPLAVTNMAVEPNGHSITTGYVLVAPLQGMNVDSNGIFTWTPQQTQSPGNYTITTIVANTNAFDTVNPVLTATNSFTVAVNEVNQAATLPTVGPQTIGELLTLTVTNTATETNIHSVTTTYTLVSALTNMNISTNGIFTWTPGQTQSPGTYAVTTVVANTNQFDTNNPVLLATNTFNVTVQEINVAPTLPLVGPQTVAVQGPLTVIDTATESNIHSQTTGYTIVSPLLGMNIDSNGVFTWTPQSSQGANAYTVTIVAANTNQFDTNNPVLLATNSFGVTVRDVNIAPVLPTIDAQTVNELTPLAVTNTATEPDSHSVTTGYTIVSPLPGMNIDSNGVFTWMPSQTQSHSSNTVTIVVANSNQFDTVNPVLLATNSFSVTVKEVNVAPVPPNILAQTVNELTSLIVTNTAIETNINSVVTNYTLVAPQLGMNIDTNGIFTWTPQQTQSPGNYTVTVVTANTNQFDTNNPVLAATNSFSVAVKEVNVAPTLPLVGPQTINESQPLTVIDTATETNIHSVTTGYTITAPLQGMSVDSNGIFTWTPTSSQSPSMTTVTIIAANSNAFDTVNPVLMTSNSFSVTVKEVNIAPVLPFITLQTVNELTPLAVTNTATEPNAHAVTTGYAIVSPLQGMNIDSNGVFTWTPSQTQSHSTNTVTIVVTNSDMFDTVNPSLTTTSSFNVVVKEVNVAPTLPLIGLQTVAEQAQLTVSDAATETNINSATTGYGIISPLAGMNIASNGLFTWTPNSSQGQNPGSYTITIVATNSNSFDTVNPTLTATNSFAVTVTAVTNNPPPANIQSITLSNGTVTIAWSSVAGQLYRVQYKTSIGATNWGHLFPDVLATGLVSTATDVISGNQKFYRVVSLAQGPANTAPVLPLQSNLTVTVGVPLTVTNTATDAQTNNLTYQLVNPPTGAMIDANGIITWTPLVAGSNTITTLVYDDGVPAMAATNKFVVTANVPVTNAPPVIQSVAVSSGNFVLTWSAVSGDNYQVQYKTNLISTNWINITPNVTASGSTASITNAIGDAPQQFYRILLLP